MKTADQGKPATRPTRLIAMGSTELTLGFRLIGFETFSEASAEDVEYLLNELVANRDKALLLLEPDLARGAVRISFGMDNTMRQAQEFLTAITAVVTRLRRLTAVAV